MLTWRASGRVQAKVEAVFGNNELGLLDLYERKAGAYVLIASNGGPGKPLECSISPESTIVRLSLRAFATSVSGQDLPVFLSLSEDGDILAADNGIPPVLNGPAPHKQVKLTPVAKHNSPTFYYFNVSFD